MTNYLPHLWKSDSILILLIEELNMNEPVKKETKSAPILVQLGIFATILFVASLLSSLFPKNFPVPTPVIGLVILYLLLTFKVIKLEWVDNLASYLISIISFLFVPSGISIAGSLAMMQKSGVQIIIVVIISTIIMLVVVTYVAKFVLKIIHPKHNGGDQNE